MNRTDQRTTGAAVAVLACAAACGPTPPLAPRAHPDPVSTAAPIAGSSSPPSDDYVFRTLRTGAAVGRHQLTTYRLRLTGDRATLAIEAQIAQTRGTPNTIDSWPPGSPIVYAGTAVQRPDVLELSLSNQTASLLLRCDRVQEQVAADDAVRTPEGIGCGDEGEWSQATLSAVDALVCTDAHDHKPDRLVFAALPGIEWLDVNDDCAMQGGGLRLIPVGGATAPFRADL